MSFSYSGLVTKSKVTLPSVDSWGTNNNIMREPPKSIHTRRKDKVGSDIELLEMQDDNDRDAEAITRYARGVNPFVSVNYQNNGGGQQASLPYKINKDDSFQVPVVAPQDLLPLSRLPHPTVENVMSKAYLQDYSKIDDNTRNKDTVRVILQDTISGYVAPTKTYPFYRTLEQFTLKPGSIHENFTNANATTNRSTNLNTNTTIQKNFKPVKEIYTDNLNVHAQTNTQNVQYTNENKNNAKADYYINEDNLNTTAFTHASTNLKQLNNNVIDFDNLRTKDAMLIEFETTKKGDKTKVDYIHENFELERVLPEYDVYTNLGDNKTQHLTTYIHDDLFLEKNLPEYDVYSNRKGETTNLVNYVHDDIELQRNIPIYESNSNVKGETTNKVNYLHKDLILNKNLPEYSFTANKNESGLQKMIQHEKIMKDFRRKTNVTTNQKTNFSKTGETNFSSTARRLNATLTKGALEERPVIPTIQRPEINTKLNDSKSSFGKQISSNYTNRFESRDFYL